MNKEAQKHIEFSNPEGLLRYLAIQVGRAKTRLGLAGTEYAHEIALANYQKWQTWLKWVQEKKDSPSPVLQRDDWPC